MTSCRARAEALVVGLAATLAAVGCTTSGGPPPGPVVSPTGIVYAEGTPPYQTRFSQIAELYLRQGDVERALEQAHEGVTADPGNPIHYYLAGMAYLRLGRYAEADAMLSDAQRIHPAYELEIEPEREQAWAAAFNGGLEAHASGDVDGTVEAWRRAVAIYDLRPEAHRNLALLLAEAGDYAEAIRVYQEGLAGLEREPASRVLGADELRSREEAMVAMEEDLTELLLLTDRFAEAEPVLRRRLAREPGSIPIRSSLASALTGLGRDAEAREIYLALLSETGLEAVELFRIGVALFRSGDFMEAADAFRQLTELQPNSRDAWFNYVNALFAAEAWGTLVSISERLVQLDPLNEAAGLIAARAHLETGDERAALRSMDRVDAAPVHVAELQLRPSTTETQIHGRIVGNVAEPGTPIRLRFTFYRDAEAVGTELVTLPAPPPDERDAFQVSFPLRATAYRYELVR